MKYFLLSSVLSLVAFGAAAAENARPAMSNKIMAAPRYTASVNQLNSMALATGTVSNVTTETITEPQPEEEKVDMREAERNACINNNIGIGNTFVWASRYSDTSNYASMTEDAKNPENNVCFVRIELKSDNESRVAVSDIPAKYFMWGETIECGSWTDAKEMEKRILEAKKGARIGGIVASTVGGAGLGVGAMELFGNKAVSAMGGTKVEGQKALSDSELHKSLLLTYKEKNTTKYNEIADALKVIEDAHSKDPNSVTNYEDYSYLIEIVK